MDDNKDNIGPARKPTPEEALEEARRKFFEEIGPVEITTVAEMMKRLGLDKQ